MAASASPRRRDRAVDALRGVAILLVVAYHAGPLGFRMPSYGPTGWIALPQLGLASLGKAAALPLFHFGYAGVHLFFVISGFCIHAGCRLGRDVVPLDGERARRYALRRLLRIAPPYWIALAIFGAVVPLALGARPAAWWDLAAHALFLHGLSTRTIFSIDPAFWSMATEVQFYALYPLAAWVIARRGIGRVLLGALLLSLAWRATLLAACAPTPEHFMVYRVWLHGLFAPRWFEWLLGCWIAEALATPDGAARLSRSRRLPWAGALLLLLAMLCRVHVVLDKLFADALLGLAFALVMASLLARERAAAGGAHPSMAMRALAAVGRRSYGAYLVHQPILDGEWAALPVRLVVAAAASLAFSLGCERPFERLAHRLAPAPARDRAASSGVSETLAARG